MTGKINGDKNSGQWVNLRVKWQEEKINKLQENYRKYPSRENRGKKQINNP